MKKLFTVLLLCLGLVSARKASAQAVQVSSQMRASSATTATGIAIPTTYYHQISWTLIGPAPTACTITVDGSADNASFSTGSLIPAQTCTSSGTSPLVNGVAAYGRINLSTFTGNGTIFISYVGYSSGPAGVVLSGTAVPTGTCTPGALYTITSTGVLYGCNNGSWATAGAAVAGATGPPTTGLMARYDIPATDSAAALTDSSGNGRNGTGTDGTPPTIAAVTGGLVCGGAGAAKLPAALNSALSIAVYMKMNPGQSVTFQAPVLGNGNGTANNAIGILLRQSQWVNNNANLISTFANGAFKSNTITDGYGTGPIIFTMDTVDHIFMGNGLESAYNGTNAASAGIQTVGFYQLCGNAINNGAGAVTRMTGTIYNAYFYDHVLSTVELAQLTQWLNSSNASRAVPLTLNTTATGNQIVISGDSISAGVSVTTAWANLLTLNQTYTINDVAQNANQMSFQVGNPTYITDQFFVPTAQNNLLINWLCTNDLVGGGRTGAQCLQDTSTFLRPRRALGWKTIIISMVDRTGASASKNTMDGLWLNNWNQIADGFVDVASDVNLGADGANANVVFFTAGVHPTQTAEYNDVTPMIQHGVNALYGNTNAATAVTYTTSAAAAVATTAVTESTNTVTVTMTATPANCQVGNLAVVAGVTAGSGTATGYNSTSANGAGLLGWLILTRSATQITYYDATTGLGAASGQGTVVCPQEQDADVYAILGGSAAGPSHTLQPCEGRSGQTIYRQITNTNATPWVITPWTSSETINGGATFTTPVAAGTNHPIVALKAIPNAYASSGCTWQASLQ